MENTGYGTDLESTSKALSIHRSVNQDIKDMISRVAKNASTRVGCLCVVLYTP